MSKGQIAAPSGSTNCSAEISVATSTEFRLENKNKANNFVWGELVSGGQLSFLIENQPADGTGCPGRWMFDRLMAHFGASVNTVLGSWTYGVNLAAVNRLTAGGATVEQAASQTWTGKRATHWQYTQVEVIQTTGSPGKYTSVQVRFRKP